MTDLMLNNITSNKTLEYTFHKYRIPLNFIGFDEDFKRPLKKGMYIFNLGDRQRGGTHWTGMWYEDGKTLYFDSFGFRPSKAILKVIGKNTFWNDDLYQDPKDGLCGLYQFVFAYYMDKYKIMKPKDRYLKFISLFRSDDARLNRGILVKEYKKIKEQNKM